MINNTNHHFYELIPKEDGSIERKQIVFLHKPSTPDVPEKGIYISSLYQSSENSIMNLGHGRAGHLPDYSFIRYAYLPAWGDYKEIIKDNPADYEKAFAQMVYALNWLREGTESFTADTYATEAIEAHIDKIREIIAKRQSDASEDWKKFGESLTKESIPDFDMDAYMDEYKNADKADKTETYLGRFIDAAIRQKSMVTAKIMESGNLLCGMPPRTARR